MTTSAANQRIMVSCKQRQRFCRAEVVWTIVSFLVLQIVFAIAIKIDLIKLSGGTTFESKAAQFQERLNSSGDDPFVVVAFGSSRIMNGFDAAGLESKIEKARDCRAVVYNFGVPGGGNIYSHLSFEKLISAGVRPDLILVEVYPPLFRHGAEFERFAKHDGRSMSFENTQRYGIKPVDRPWYQEWLFPWHTYRFFVLNRIAPKLLPMGLRENWTHQADAHGWIAVDHLPEKNKVTRQLNGFRGKFKGFELSPDSCRAVRDTLRLCEQHDIQCKLVWMPEFESIRQEYPAAVVTEVREFLDSLKTEFGVDGIVARDWIDDNGFYDSCHLNRNGATRFTSQLTKRDLRIEQIAKLTNPLNDSELQR